MKNENQPINPTNVQQVGNEVFRPIRDNDPKEHNVSFLGLTKREYFAGLAMQSILSGEAIDMKEAQELTGTEVAGYDYKKHYKIAVAKKALQYADELLKQISTTEA